MKHVRQGSVMVFLMSLGMVLAACGPASSAPTAASTSRYIPSNFWRHIPYPLIRRTAFPRTPGGHPCEIPTGTGSMTIAGWCTTGIEPVSESNFPHLPPGARSQAVATVTLTEQWPTRQSATLLFLISHNGQILAKRQIGAPPQLWI